METEHSPSIDPGWAATLAGCAAVIRRDYPLRWEGLHGAGHWARVLENGLRLAMATAGVRVEVVTAFAVLHDSCRRNDLMDPQHGARAALRAREFGRRGLLPLDAPGLALLEEACRRHTGGMGPADATVLACWDSDRLDLPRIAGVDVDVQYLGTPLAKDPAFIAASTARARSKVFPFRHLFDPTVGGLA